MHFIDYKTNEQILDEETETPEEKLCEQRKKLPTIRSDKKIGVPKINPQTSSSKTVDDLGDHLTRLLSTSMLKMEAR
jgi:hypothetical protein